MDREPQRPLTVVQVTTSGNRSGGTRQLFLLCEGLRAGGHRVVFAAVQGSPALAWAQERGFETLTVAAGTFRETWKSARSLRRLAREAGADIVHAHHTQGHNLALLASFGGGFPPVVANRGVVFRPAFPAKFRSRRTAAIITNSEAARQVLLDRGVSADKVHVVYNAKVAPSLEELAERGPGLRREFELPEGAPVVGAVGSAQPGKGFQHLLAAMPRILERFPEAVLVLAGGGTRRLRSRAEELGVASRVRLVGPRKDAVAVMGLFDVFVLPSLSESCPNVLIEAMGVGAPAVCSDLGGVREILEDGRLGRLVPPADPVALGDEVCAVLAAPDAARQVARDAREAALRRFTVANKVDGTLLVYRQLLCRGR